MLTQHVLDCLNPHLRRSILHHIGSPAYGAHTFSAFWLRSSVVSVLISLISDRHSMSVQLIKPISVPSLASEACFMSGRGPGAAVQPGAAGGFTI